METYISRCQNTAMELFLKAERRPVSRVPKSWRDKEVLGFVGLREDDEGGVGGGRLETGGWEGSCRRRQDRMEL